MPLSLARLAIFALLALRMAMGLDLDISNDGEPKISERAITFLTLGNRLDQANGKYHSVWHDDILQGQ